MPMTETEETEIIFLLQEFPISLGIWIGILWL